MEIDSTSSFWFFYSNYALGCRHMTQPIFNSPQWTFRAAESTVTIAGLSGDITVTRNDRQVRVIHTVPPSDIFKFAKEVLKAESLEDWHFYLDIIKGGKRLVLGIQEGSIGAYFDLWYYTPSDLPAWYTATPKRRPA